MDRTPRDSIRGVIHGDSGGRIFIFFSLLLLPTTLLGITFPIACRLYAKCNSLLGTEVSAVYAFNTAGGILGSLIAAFVLIPRTGLQITLVLSSCIGLATAVLLAVHDREATVIYRTALTGFSVGILALSVILIPRWDTELMVFRCLQIRALLPIELGLRNRAEKRQARVLQSGRHEYGIDKEIPRRHDVVH